MPDGQSVILGGIVGGTEQEDFDNPEMLLVHWEVASGEAIRTFNGYTGVVNSVAFTPDESQIISGSAGGAERAIKLTVEFGSL